jgi:DNA-binding transcriptional LysR family regulator
MEWSDIRVFLAVARGGSLRAAARELALTQPTVLRRLRTLEAALDVLLFERTPDGHRLTDAGRDLMPLAESMAETAAAIDRRRAAYAEDTAGVVKIYAGEWGAAFLAERMGDFARNNPAIILELSETHSDPDLARREADLMVRHGLPERGDLLAVGLGTMQGTLYAARDYADATPESLDERRWKACNFVSFDAPHEYFSTMAWLTGKLGERSAQVRASRIHLQHAAIRAGAGIGILPCFLGDIDERLVRVAPAPVPALAADLWLLVHPDLRHVPRIRTVIDWLQKEFRRCAPALAGAPQSAPSSRPLAAE